MEPGNLVATRRGVGVILSISLDMPPSIAYSQICDAFVLDISSGKLDVFPANTLALKELPNSHREIENACLKLAKRLAQMASGTAQAQNAASDNSKDVPEQAKGHDDDLGSASVLQRQLEDSKARTAHLEELLKKKQREVEQALKIKHDLQHELGTSRELHLDVASRLERKVEHRERLLTLLGARLVDGEELMNATLELLDEVEHKNVEIEDISDDE